MSNPEFKKNAQEFLEPILSYLPDCNPSCQIYWVYPNEVEENYDFSMPLQDVERYTSSFIYEGFFAAIRIISNEEEKLLQVVLWEEWDGSFKQVYWPNLDGIVIKHWVWQGASSATK